MQKKEDHEIKFSRLAGAANTKAMPSTSIIRLAAFAFLVAITLWLLIPSSKKYSRSPHAPARTPGTPTFKRRVVAIGDLHGDLPNALKVLEMAGVIDSERQWTGNTDYLVQTGDIVDRFVYISSLV